MELDCVDHGAWSGDAYRELVGLCVKLDGVECFLVEWVWQHEVQRMIMGVELDGKKGLLHH